jgi:general secretion pathway protein B
MSYILDALRRADAQRESDPARGIHAQTAAVAQPPARPRALALLAGFLGAGALALAGYALWPAPSQPDAPVRLAAPAAVPAPAAPAVATAISPAAPAVPAPPPVVQKVAAAAPERAAPRPAPAVAPPAAAGPAGAASAGAPPAVAAPAGAAVAPAAAPDRIVAFSELPPDIQRELPKLAISGSVHSDNAAQRLLVVGGQVVNEGAELAPGVVLEQIRARSAVLRFRNWRYSVGF